jgi:diguanylate cyclase (GGDEF)-like protein
MSRKPVVTKSEELEARIVRLSRENAALRKEIGRLEVYRSMAYRDPLTGLWNRRYCEERLKEEFSRLARAGSGRRFSVLVIDIDDFKSINDRHGHPVGDILLRWVGEFLTSHLRTHDVPCRTGGDEFTVLLPDLSAEDCGRLVARLHEQLDATNGGREIPVNLSLGTASWPEVAGGAEQLLACADEAMYDEKRRHKAARPEAPAGDEQAEADRPDEAGRRFRASRSRAHVPVA